MSLNASHSPSYARQSHTTSTISIGPTPIICMDYNVHWTNLYGIKGETGGESMRGSHSVVWMLGNPDWLNWDNRWNVWFMRPIFDHYGWSQTSLVRGGWLENEQTNVLLLHSGCNLSCRSHACVILTKSVQFLFPFLSSSCLCDRPGAYKCAFLIEDIKW